jgi:electron transport complex protein RnfG
VTTPAAAPQDPAAPPPAPPAPPAPPDVPAWKLLSVLGGGGAVAGMVIVVAFQATQPRIQAHKAMVLEASVKEVLGGPESFRPLYVVDQALTAALPAGADAAKLDKVYAGRKADGSPAGFAIVAAEPGFADEIKVIFGYDPGAHRILGFKVLENKETPGLGDGIEKKSSYFGQFAGKTAPLVPIKKGQSRGHPASEVETITGATISSGTVVRIINHAVARWEPLLGAWHEEAPR